MKTILTTFAIALFLGGNAFSQDRTTVNAVSYDISDNLDLRAVASIFGDSRDLEDFENRLNDPKTQISNLDLNRDNQVDYLRVIESVEKNTHLIIIQAVLERDVFQDVATIEVERDRHNNVQVQVVGDVYMYGSNYIYEPVYVHTPVFYVNFWSPVYRPYYSSWYYGYYPSYYYAWNPYPTYYYHNHIHNHINVYNEYNYVNVRRSARAQQLYSTRRSDGYARQHPERSFAQRNAGATNRQSLTASRNTVNSQRATSTSARTAPTANSARTAQSTRSNATNAVSQRPSSRSAAAGNTVQRSNVTETTAVAPRQAAARSERSYIADAAVSATPQVRATTPQRSLATPRTAPARTQSDYTSSRNSAVSAPSASRASSATTSRASSQAPSISSGTRTSARR